MPREVNISGTVRERAVRELRDRILTGALPAGTRVDLDAITAEFATSRTPVREALLELSFEGLVHVAPRSGVTVIGISSKDVIDSFTILGVLTGQAAAWAAQRVTPQELASLRELAAEVAARSGDDSIGEANWRFHQ
jgi:DNA-binding GntR family transcriptional regulator